MYGPGTCAVTKGISYPSVRVKLALHGLKQSDRLWYETHLAEHDFRNVSILLSMFVKWFGDEFAIIAVDRGGCGAEARLATA